MEWLHNVEQSLKQSYKLDIFRKDLEGRLISFEWREYNVEQLNKQGHKLNKFVAFFFQMFCGDF